MDSGVCRAAPGYARSAKYMKYIFLHYSSLVIKLGNSHNDISCLTDRGHCSKSFFLKGWLSLAVLSVESLSLFLVSILAGQWWPGSRDQNYVTYFLYFCISVFLVFLVSILAGQRWPGSRDQNYVTYFCISVFLYFCISCIPCINSCWPVVAREP